MGKDLYSENYKILMKIIENYSKKCKDISAHGLEDLILLNYLYYLKQSIRFSVILTKISMTKEARIYNGKKTTSLTNGAGKTGQTFVKE